MNGDTAIEVVGLARSFGETTALTSVDLSLEAGKGTDIPYTQARGRSGRGPDLSS